MFKFNSTLKLFNILILNLWATISMAQISGKVTNKEGEPLPFASVYVENTTRGTTTNADGDYTIDLAPGTYVFVYQYVGYQQFTKKITLNTKIVSNVTLQDISTEIREVVINASAEDPAYNVIRQAIAKRVFHRDGVKSFACEVYIKGLQKILFAPKKFMGRDLGDLGGSLDSNRQGIVYLSESLAKYYSVLPNQKKEIMISSKVSGRDNGFSFNRATAMDFNFYENNIEIQRQILSPIADNALNYYRYKLLGTFYDKDGTLINKIEVIPKRKEDPTFAGTIYILENQWNIQSTDLYVTGKSIKQDVLDTLWIRQVHVPVEGDKWRLFSQKIDFKFGFLGFKLAGNFTGIFTNYDLKFVPSKNFFSSEIFKVVEKSNEKDTIYWSKTRPVPLTTEENKDYVKKDSLKIIKKTKYYLDSIDNRNNRFTIGSLLLGYNYANSYRNWNIGVASPLFALQFNPVQGFNIGLNVTCRKNLDEIKTRWWELNSRTEYGFFDLTWRAKMQATYHFNRTNEREISMEYGNRIVSQFNEKNPLSPTLNSYYDLIAKANFLRIFEKTYAKINFQQEISNGVFVTAQTEYAFRSPLSNRTNYSWLKRNKTYAANDFIDNEQVITVPQHQILTAEIGVRLRYKQKYLSYPNKKFITGSNLPELWIRYKKGINVGKSDANFDKLSFTLSQGDLGAGIWGYSEFQIEGGALLNKNKLYFNDWNHFNGMPFLYGNRRYLSSFILMQHYEYSTTEMYGLGHWQHHFEGFFFDKVPLLRKLGWKEVAGFSILQTGEKKNYMEFNFGIENIGKGAFRILRVDLVANFENGKYRKTGLAFTLNL